MMNGFPKFQNVETLSDENTEKLLTNIATKILKHLRRKGYLNLEGDVVDNSLADGLFIDHESLAQATASSIAGKIAFGPNAVMYVTARKAFSQGRQDQTKLCFGLAQAF